MRKARLGLIVCAILFCQDASAYVGILSTLAGNGSCCFSGDGGPAASASVGGPTAVAVDKFGNLFIAEQSNRIRKVANGIISTVAGNGQQGFSGDGGAATSASLNNPEGIAVDGKGNLYIADRGNGRVRKVSATGTITTVAGNGKQGFSGDGGPATSSSLNQPQGVAVDGAGNLYIADTYNGRVRKVSLDGTITTIAGGGTSSFLISPTGLAVDNSGNLYIGDVTMVRFVSSSGVITTFAGTSKQGYSGDGGQATAADLGDAISIALDSAGNLLIADVRNARIRRVSVDGVITTVAGNGTTGYSGDGSLATSGKIDPWGLAIDASGNLYVAEYGNNRVRESSLSAVTVSAATYVGDSAVAPDSLIAVFGAGLAPKTEVGSLDSIGQLPVTLAGTTVKINGLAAGLIFVSPSQINCVVPTKVSTGLATVSVFSSGTLVAAGSVQVAIKAPGLFSANGSGTGVAVAVNGVTGAGSPFPVVTQKNPSGDKRTRVLLFGTGMRYTDNPSQDPKNPNVAGAVEVDARDAMGNPVPISTEYVGPAPGFFGLDQVNLILPPEAGSSGNLSVQMYAGTAASNRLSVPVLQSAGPVVTSVQPSTGAPGATLTITGSGFVVEDLTVPPVRNAVYLRLPSGTQITLPVTGTESSSGLTVILLPLQADGSFYQGPAQVCVSVDSQQGCSSSTIQVGALKSSSATAGSGLLALQQQLATAIANYFTAAGLPTAAATVQAGAKTNYANLQSYILAAQTNTIFTIQQADGTAVTLHPSMTTIATMEALIANSSISGTLLSLQPHTAIEPLAPLAASTTQCASPAELALRAQPASYNLFHPTLDRILADVGTATAIATPIICRASLFACGIEMAGLYVSLVGIESLSSDLVTQSSSYWLDHIAATPVCAGAEGGCLSVPVGNALPFQIVGYFGPKISVQGGVNSAAVQILAEAVATRVTASLAPLTSPGVEQGLAAGLIAKIKNMFAEKAADAASKFPAPDTSLVPVLLSSASVSTPNAQDAYVSLTLTCGSTAAAALGKQVTPVASGRGFPSLFPFSVDRGSFLLKAGALLRADLHVSVTDLFSVVPASDYSAAGQQGNIGTSAKTYTLTSSVSSPISYSVKVAYGQNTTAWLSVSPATGTVSGKSSVAVTVSVSSAAQTLGQGIYSATITFASGGTSISRNATLTVNPTGACVDISGPWNASESGSYTISIVAPIETDSETDSINASGVVPITQSGCSIGFYPLPISGLIGSNLTSSQRAQTQRTGTITGNSVTATGIVALIDTVVAAQNGITITNVSSNQETATGQIIGGVLTLSGTGKFAASGTYSIDGQRGSFTLSITTSAIAKLTRGATGQTIAAVKSLNLLVDRNVEDSPISFDRIERKIGIALMRALTIVDR